MTTRFVIARFLLGPILMSPKSQIDHIFSHHENPHVSKPVDKPPRESSPLPDDPERRPLLQHAQSSQSAERSQFVERTQPTKPLSHRMWSGAKSAFNPPLVGGIAAVIVGAIPFLHKLLLQSDSPLSFITTSIRSLGKLYTALQMFVLGGQLYSKRQMSFLPFGDEALI
jgi:predicted permease